MIQIPYNSSSARKGEGSFEQAHKIIGEYLKYVPEEFRESTTSLSLMRQLPFVLRACNGDLRGKKILDLGCGSIFTRSFMENFEGYKGFYEPWLCRFLKYAEAVPVGVDINDNLSETFENYKIDLTQEGCFSGFPDSSFDVAHAGSFFTLHNLEDYSGVKDNLIVQLERIVKPDGAFVFEEL